MRTALYVAVGVIAAMLGALAVPDAVNMVSWLLFEWADPVPVEPWALGVSGINGWLDVALWVGLALIAERALPKALFLGAALVAAAVTLGPEIMLVQLVWFAATAPERIESAAGLPVWLYYLQPALVAAAWLVWRQDHEWLTRAALAVLGIDVLRSVLPVQDGPDGGIVLGLAQESLNLGYVAASLILLFGIAYWAFGRVRAGLPSNKGIERTAQALD
jgi:hypothetical protein